MATATQPFTGFRPEAVQFLADRLRMDGYCVLENAVPLDLIERSQSLNLVAFINREVLALSRDLR